MTGGLTLYTNPNSRGGISRWMLEEVGQSYETVFIEYGPAMKSPDYLAINPMGKVPAIVHHGQVVTECAAICAYLAEAFPEASLKPGPDGLADYYRWMFFAAGPVEAAFSNRAAGFAPPEDKQRMFGYGHFELAIDTLETAVAGKSYVAGDRFSAADVYVGSMLDFMVMFGQITETPELSAYLGPLRERDAFKRARNIDAEARNG